MNKDIIQSYFGHEFLVDEVRCCDEGTDVLEFGVYSGASLYALLKQFRDICLCPRKVFGFDSFQGLRLEKSDEVIHRDWENGSFDARQLFNTNNVEEIVEQIKQFFKNDGLDVEIIVDFFQNLNTKTIALYDIQPARYINIDCDLYSAAKSVLNFIFDNDLLALNGLIRYDDYYSVLDGGEEKAHKELVEERGLRFEYLSHSIFRYQGKI